MEVKNVLITGGSRGIGAVMVKELAQKGYHIIANYNKSEEKMKQIQMDLRQRGYNIDIYQADVSNQIEVKNMIESILDTVRTIDVVINNAGIDEYKMFQDITKEDWDKMISTNLSSAFYVSQEVGKHMISKKAGCIINISSIWGITGASCEVHYSVSKAGLDGMTKALAKELAPSQIRVNSIAPGIIDTEMNQNLSQEELKKIEEEIPLGKIGKAESIARCAEWLIEDDYTTGQIISVNGGWVI